MQKISEISDNNINTEKNLTAAWIDDEDDRIKINLNKSNRTKKLKKDNENQISGINHLTKF